MGFIRLDVRALMVVLRPFSHISNLRIVVHLRVLERLLNLSKRLRIEGTVSSTVLQRGPEQVTAQ